MTSAQRFLGMAGSAVAVSWLIPSLALLVVELLFFAVVLAAPTLLRQSTDACIARNRAQGALIDAEWALYVAATDVSRREHSNGGY